MLVVWIKGITINFALKVAQINTSDFLCFSYVFDRKRKKQERGKLLKTNVSQKLSLVVLRL